MAEIISLDNKLQLAKGRKTALLKKRKLSAVQKVFQCTHCAFKCEKCGTQMNLAHPNTGKSRDLRIPYRFCDSCSEEYIDYIERLKGGGDSDRYWHNETWLAAWRAWIEYQSAVDRYLKSKEFLQLLQELKQTCPEK